jgi:hypothetical protein
MESKNKGEVLYMEGEIKKITEKTNDRGRDFYFLEMVSGTVSGFGKAPPKLLEAEKGKQRVRIGFRMSQDGKYRNIVPGDVLIVSDLPKQEILPQTEETNPGKTGIQDLGFKSADTLGDLDQLQGAAGILYKMAWRTFFEVSGREPKTDGEFASVNSVFIYVSQRMTVDEVNNKK